jgi:hypothetical protein
LTHLSAKRLAWCGTLATIAIFAVFTLTGCGASGTANIVPVPPVITPAGSFTITVTPSAVSGSGQPLQVAPIPLTLNVSQ